MPWTYILKCADNSYYTGSCWDLESRLEQHAAGAVDSYTAIRRPLHLAWSEHFPSVSDAYGAERRIKGWSRAKKEALIEGRLDDLPGLAKNRQSRDDIS